MANVKFQVLTAVEETTLLHMLKACKLVGTRHFGEKCFLRLDG